VQPRLGRGSSRPPTSEVIGVSALQGVGSLQLCQLLRWPHFSPFPTLTRCLARGVCTAPLILISCLHFSAPRRPLLALPCSSSSAFCTSPLLGISLLHFPAPRCQPRIVLSSIQFCFWQHFLRRPLNPVLPAMRFGVGSTPGDSRPGLGRLCSIHPPSAGHSDLDVDTNYTALTPRPRLSSPSGAVPIVFTEHHSLPVYRSFLGSAS